MNANMWGLYAHLACWLYGLLLCFGINFFSVMYVKYVYSDPWSGQFVVILGGELEMVAVDVCQNRDHLSQ